MYVKLIQFARSVTLKDMGKLMIQYHNKTPQIRTECLFLIVYCMWWVTETHNLIIVWRWKMAENWSIEQHVPMQWIKSYYETIIAVESEKDIFLMSLRQLHI